MTRFLIILAALCGLAVGWCARGCAPRIVTTPGAIVERVRDSIITRPYPVTVERVVYRDRPATVPVPRIVVEPSRFVVTIMHGDTAHVYSGHIGDGPVTGIAQPDGTMRFTSPRATWAFAPVLGVYAGTSGVRPFAGVEVARLPRIRLALAGIASPDGFGTLVAWSPHYRVTGRVGIGATYWPYRSAFMSIHVPFTR